MINSGQTGEGPCVAEPGRSVRSMLDESSSLANFRTRPGRDSGLTPERSFGLLRRSERSTLPQWARLGKRLIRLSQAIGAVSSTRKGLTSRAWHLGPNVGRRKSKNSMKLQKAKQARGLLASLRVYLHEWGIYPFRSRYPVRYAGVLAALLLVAWLAIWRPYFSNNIPYRSTHLAVARIERIDHSRPGPKEGFAMKEVFVLRVDGQEVEVPASFRGVRGEYVAVNYVVDLKGHVSISSISPAKH